jgi:hypothetical protein
MVADNQTSGEADMGLNRFDHERSVAEAHLTLLGWEPGVTTQGVGITNGVWCLYRIADPVDKRFSCVVSIPLPPLGWKPCAWDEIDEPLLWQLVNELNIR